MWFGGRWITSVFDLLEENVRYFPALLPICSDEDPAWYSTKEARQPGRAAAARPRSTAGTVPSTTWSATCRTCASRTGCCRRGRRWSTSWPTLALYYGLVRVLAEDDRPVWTRMSFSVAEENFQMGARDGIDAHLYWPGLGEVPATELALRRLLPMAADGLARWGVDTAVSDRLLGILQQRCLTSRNGAEWRSGDRAPAPGGAASAGRTLCAG